MRSFTSTKLLALAAPAALLLSTSAPAAHADDGEAAAAQVAAPAATTMLAATAGLASLAAGLRAAVMAATSLSRPLVDADGCPLPGNVGKGAMGGSCGREARALAAQLTPPASGSRR